jgi:transcription elongation GreA/GreB family factor
VSRPSTIDKAALRQALVERLSEELASRFKAARAAEAGATDPQNKAENKYDTRGLELSYLAAGQGRQIAELQASIAEIQAMTLRDFTASEPAGLSALVTLACATPGEDETIYFIAPGGGGSDVQMGKREVVVITPLSPLGRQLIGKKKGDEFSLTNRGPLHRVLAVC